MTDYRVAASGSHLQHFLARPDVPAFLAAAPQALRHLRPLCRMLGTDLPPAIDPPRPPKPRARKITPEPVPPPTGTPFRPIPANILAAARAWRRRHG